MQLWVWRSFRILLPADWEMLQFTRDMNAGRCAFADRHQFRLELDWRVVPGPPDFGRMLSDYRARLLELGMTNVRNVSRKAWNGILCNGPDGESTRFGRHFPGESCLLELVFLWRNGRNVGEETTVLDSIAAEPERDGNLRRWRAFGMDLLATSGRALERCVVEPGLAEMKFAATGGWMEERFARLGMVSEWLSGPVSSWAMTRAPRELTMTDSGTYRWEGHEMTRVSGTLRAGGIRGILGKRTRYEAEAWICPGDGRLYSVSRTSDSSKEGAISRLAGNRLTCCAGLAQPGGSV